MQLKPSTIVFSIALALALLLSQACAAPNLFNAADPTTDEYFETAVLRCILTSCWVPPTWSRSVNPSSNSDSPLGLAVDGAYVYVCGDDESPGSGNKQMRLEKRDLRTGHPAPSFGAGGVLLENPSALDDRIQKVAVNSTSIFLAVTDSVPGNLRWRLEKRDIHTGALDASFGAAGIITFDSAGDDQPDALVLTESSLFVVGHDSQPGNKQWRVEKRDLITGALDATFNGGSALQINPTANDDIAVRVLVDGNDLFIGGYDRTPGSPQWRLEKRNAITGILDTGFAGGGIINVKPSTGFETIRGLAADGTAVYIAGRDRTPGNNQWRLEKYDRITGTPVTAFGSGGVITIDISSGDDIVDALHIKDGKLYAFGTDNTTGTARMHIRVYDAVSGQLDPTFGGDGILTYSPGTGVVKLASQIAVTDTNIYLAMSDATPDANQWVIESRRLSSGGF